MSAQHNGGDAPQNIAAAITDISERASVLVREEIELAKAELTEKATRLARGTVVAVVAGVFLAYALLFLLIGCAWLLYYYLPGNDFAFFWGFFAMALILVVLGVAAGLIAARAVKRGSPPVPTMAIEEAHRIRETVAPTHPTPPDAGPPPGPVPPGPTPPRVTVPPTPATSAPVPPPGPDAPGAAG